MKKRLIALFLTIDVIVYILIFAFFHEHIYASLLSPIITIIIMNLVSKEFRKAYFGKSL